MVMLRRHQTGLIKGGVLSEDWAYGYEFNDVAFGE
jgi:hypothetical protein